MIRLRVNVDGRYGYIDERGVVVIPPSFTFAGRFAEGLAYVNPAVNSLAVIDVRGDVQGTIASVETYSCFAEGLLEFRADDGDRKVGFIDRDANIVIPPTFDTASDFADGSSVVLLDEKYGVIYRSGKFVIPPRFEFLRPFQAGEAVTAYRDGRRWGFIDRSGKVVVQPKFEQALVTSQGRTPVCLPNDRERRYGIVDNAGQWLVPPRFDNCGASYFDGTLPVEVGDQWGVIDLDGAWVIAPHYTSANSFHEGLSRVYVGGRRDLDYCLIEGKFGFIDRSDQLVIAAEFDNAEDFHEGISQVEEFYVDAEGEELRRYGWINRSGAYLWRPT